MGLTMKEKKAISKKIAKRYKKTRKREKGKKLDEFTKLTNYSRCYASYVLRNWAVELTLAITKKRKRKRIYDYIGYLLPLKVYVKASNTYKDIY